MSRPACTATRLVEDDRVIVTRFDFVAVAETGWHRHGQSGRAGWLLDEMTAAESVLAFADVT